MELLAMATRTRQEQVVLQRSDQLPNNKIEYVYVEYNAEIVESFYVGWIESSFTLAHYYIPQLNRATLVTWLEQLFES